VDELKAALEERFHGRYWLDVEEPKREEADQVPSLVSYPGFLKPFVPLVKSYGVPRYGEFDPTLPFAFTYLLLFGAMFGDIGHGAVILRAVRWDSSRRLGRRAPGSALPPGPCPCSSACSTAASSATRT
jgi:V/A-type H+-transporting ATPase subunit I